MYSQCFRIAVLDSATVTPLALWSNGPWRWSLIDIYQLCGGFSLYIYRDDLFDRHSGSGVDLGWSVLCLDTERISARKDFLSYQTTGSSPEPSL